MLLPFYFAKVGRRDDRQIFGCDGRAGQDYLFTAEMGKQICQRRYWDDFDIGDKGGFG